MAGRFGRVTSCLSACEAIMAAMPYLGDEAWVGSTVDVTDGTAEPLTHVAMMACAYTTSACEDALIVAHERLWATKGWRP